MSNAFEDLLRQRPAPVAGPMPTVTGSAYGLQALASEVANVESAGEGVRNHTLNVAAFNLGQLVGSGDLTKNDVFESLLSAGLRAGLGERECRKTIASGLSKGMTDPRIVAELDLAAPPVTVLELPVTTPAPATWSAEGLSEEQLEQLRAEHAARQLAVEVATQRLRRDARRFLDHEDAVASFRVPPWRPTLTDELAIPDPPVTYAIDRLLPTGGNVLLTAGFKTGKTTLVNALAKALADREPFLENFGIDDLGDKRVALFNYEVDERQYRRWLRDAGIRNTDRVAVLNLRGYRLPVTVPHIEDWVVEWLTERNVGLWVVDPFARAFTGCGSENDNAEVGAFLDALDVIKARAGVSELVLTTHTGRAEQAEGQERARGATRLDDWPDVRWVLTKDDAGIRYLRATGRDVDVEEEALTFDPDTRGLTFGGGDRKWNRDRSDQATVERLVLATPGIKRVELRDAVIAAVGCGKARADRAIAGAVGQKLVYTVTGDGGSLHHYPIGHMPTVAQKVDEGLLDGADDDR